MDRELQLLKAIVLPKPVAVRFGSLYTLVYSTRGIVGGRLVRILERCAFQGGSKNLAVFFAPLALTPEKYCDLFSLAMDFIDATTSAEG